MSYTLLDLVQTILSSMDSDEVDTINDTTESLQVAYIVRDTYNDIVSHLELPKHFNFYELTASGDTAKPTLMFLPSNAKSLDWVKYNNCDTAAGDTSPKFFDVQYVPMDQYLAQMKFLDSDSMDNVIAFTHAVAGLGTFDFLSYTDRFPTKYTTWDDYTLVFDAYDSDNDSTLQASKSQAYGELTQTFTLADSYIFPFDDRQFSLLLNEAKSQAFAELKQAQNVVADRRARRGWVSGQHLKQKVKSLRYQDMNLPNYGRRV